MIGWLFALGGSTVGAAQAGLIARSTRQGPHPLDFLLRLLLVGGVLFLAARSGHLLPAAAGWLLGFAAGIAVFYWRAR